MKDWAVCDSVLHGGSESRGGSEPTERREEALPALVSELRPAEGAFAEEPVARGPGARVTASEHAEGRAAKEADDPPSPASRPNGQPGGKPQQVVLRQGKAGAAELSVDWSSSTLQATLRVAAGLLCSGAWQAIVRVAGTVKAPAGPWNEVCRHHDARSDYLELEQPLDDGWRLVRQMLLARQDQFLLMADSVLGPPAAREAIDYQLQWPLAAGGACTWAKESWEGWLVRGGQRQASLLPLALPEWRAAWEDGALASEEGMLQLHQSARGRALYAPLWWDLSRGRLRRALTWRRLTVGENLSVVPRDEAVGYRVQIGREQWLIYHSLAPVGNRSVLGLNTCAAFVCGRFLPSGKVEEIVVIE